MEELKTVSQTARDPTIGYARLLFSGFFTYDIDQVRAACSQGIYSDRTNYYLDNKDYFDQKYYSNWIRVVYPYGRDLETADLKGLQTSHLLYQQPLGTVEVELKGTPAILHPVELTVFLFRDKIGIFSIEIIVPDEQLHFNTLSQIAKLLRTTADNTQYPLSNPLAFAIFNKVITPLGGKHSDWRQFNPQLRVFMNIDIRAPFITNERRDDILMNLATLRDIDDPSSDDLYGLSKDHSSEIRRKYALEVFNNWTAVCLYDTFVRISIRPNPGGTHDLWEDEYYQIYIFTTFIRHYLHLANRRLADFKDISKKAALRDDYISFLNDVELTRISYKFLPNLIYEKLMLAMHIGEEMEWLEEKLDRIDVVVREAQEKRIVALLRFFTLCSIFSLISSTTQFFSSLLGLRDADGAVYTKTFRICAAVLFVVAGLGMVYFYRKRK